MSNQQRWKDKSEGRFSSLKSPRKSILRTAESPLRFNSPLYLQDGPEERKVSFAPDANFRLFNSTDSPNAPRFMSNMITEEFHVSDIQNIFDENEPSELNADIMDSPASRLKRPSESPFDHRKRRPDLFGSPSTYKSPNVKVTGTPPTLLNRVNVGDLTDYLPDLTIKRRRNIFEEDDDEDDEDLRLNSAGDIRQAQTPIHSHKKIHLLGDEEIDANDRDGSYGDMISSLENTQSQTMVPRENRQENDVFESTQQSDMLITQERPVENTQKSDMMITQEQLIDTQQSDMILTQEQPIRNTQQSDMMMTQEHPAEITQQSDMMITRELFNENTRRSDMTIIEDTRRSDMMVTENTERSDMMITERISPLRSKRTPIETLQRTPRRAQRTIESPQRMPLQVAPKTPTRSSYLGSPARSLPPRRRMSEFSPRSLFEKSPASDRSYAAYEVPAEKSPHFYDPKDDITNTQRKITLSEYLLYAGITFPDDLPVERDISDQEVQNDITDNVLESLPILPELYLYQEACDQLIASIKKSDDIIDKIDREVSETNPQLFVEFIDATVTSQMKISQQLEDIKKYSLLRSEQEWISLWTNKLKEFPGVLKEYLNVLDQYHDLQTIQAQKLEKIETYRDALSAALLDYRKKEQQYRTTDHHKLSELKQEIEIQGSFYNDLENKANDLNYRGQELTEENKALDDEIKRLHEALKETELAISKTSNITTKDLLYAKRDYELYSNLFRWKLKRNDDQILHVEIGRGIDIMIDLIKLAHRTPDAVAWQIATSIAEELGPIVELLHGFDIIAQNRADPKEILQDIACYWSSVEIIKRQLDRTNGRTWTKLTTLEDPFDSTMAGFAYDVCLFSFKDKLRVEIRLEIKVKDVFQMPTIDFSTLTLKICYGDVEHDTMKNLIIQELTENGIIGLDQSLKTIIAKVADLQGSE